MSELRLREHPTEFTLVREPEAGDPDFVTLRVQARSAWFQVDFFERLEPRELREIAEALRRLHADMAGSFVFHAQTNWLELTFAMAKRGDLHVSIRLQNAPDYLNEVRLFLNLDQNSLPEFAQRFEDLIAP